MSYNVNREKESWFQELGGMTNEVEFHHRRSQSRKLEESKTFLKKYFFQNS
jgi:hypothetical protein